MVDLSVRPVTIRRRILFGMAAVVFVLISTLLVTPLFDLTRFQLTVGQPSPRNISARHPFKIEDRERQGEVLTASILSIPPRFIRDPEVEKVSRDEAIELIDAVRKISRSAGAAEPQPFPDWVDPVAAQEAQKLSDRGWSDLEKSALALIREFMAEKGILSDAQDAGRFDLHRHTAHEIQYDRPRSDTRVIRLVRGPPVLIDSRGLPAYVESSVREMPAPRLLSAILLRTIRPNQIFDREHFRLVFKREKLP